MGRLNPCPVCGCEAISQFRKVVPLQFAYEHCGICGGYRNDWKAARLAWNKTTAEWILEKERTKVDRHTATECAYKNGFAAGLRAAERRAKWIFCGQFHAVCSACEEIAGGKYRYCPNCGAKMEESK